MAEQPDWKALLANKSIHEFVDELLTVVSGWAIDADFKASDAQIDVPYTFRTGRYIKEDIFNVIGVLNKHALYRARRRLLKNEPKTSHLSSLPGNVLMKIFNFLREDPAKMPMLFTIKKPILADASAHLRRTYLNELFTNQPLLMEIYPEASSEDQERHSKTFVNAAYDNRFLRARLSKRHEEGLPGVLHLHIKVTPERADDLEESLESPITVAILFSTEQGKLTRPTLTISYDSSRPWRHTTALTCFWRVAINSMWDGGELHNGLGLKVIGRLFNTAGWFIRELWRKDLDARNPLLRPLFRPPPANDNEDNISEDLFEDESDDEDDDTETEVDEEVEREEGAIVVQLLESTWFTGELSPATWRELKTPILLDMDFFD